MNRWSSSRAVRLTLNVLGMHPAGDRYWEVDFLRGIAVIGMVLFHTVWNLDFFNLISPELFSAFEFSGYVRYIFITLVGVSLSISYRRAISKGNVSQRQLFLKYLQRGVTIFLWGVVVTVALLVSTGGRVDFGILHLIGFSIVVAFPFLKYRLLNMLFAFAVWGIAVYFGTIEVNFNWLVWLGIEPNLYNAVDYFPVFPWFALVLAGIFIGNVIYSDSGRNFKFPELGTWKPIQWILWIGRNALFIYLIHQPIIFGIIALVVNLNG